MTTKTKQVVHTPGPWIVEEFCAADSCDGENAETAICAYANPDGTDGVAVAHVNRWTFKDQPPTPESAANARLIAAAPELLSALVAIAEFGEANGGAFALSAAKTARAAIAKATGETV